MANPYLKYMSAEDRLQSAIVHYIRVRYSAIVIPMNTESKKSRFEQFKFKFMGGQKGIPVPGF